MKVSQVSHLLFVDDVLFLRDQFGSTKILEVDCRRLQGCVRSENKPTKK